MNKPPILPIIKIFKDIQKIPYKCRSEYPLNLTINISYANCTQKRDLLKKCIELYGYRYRNLDVIFDWKDLPIPESILGILKLSGTKQKHHLLEVWINGEYIKVDSTWNLELEKKRISRNPFMEWGERYCPSNYWRTIFLQF